MPLIRRGEARDLDRIAEIQQASPEAAHWTVADYLHYEFQVAEIERQVAGFLVARLLVPGEMEILNVAVAPEMRRKGIAAALVQSVLTDRPITVFLEARESNLAARMLYKSMGFQEVSVRQEYYTAPSEAAIVMKFHSC